MSEKSKLQGMLSAKCPVCKTGDMFPVSVVSYRKLTDVNPVCSHCEANLMPEPDFYYGAMYISYAFSVALFVAVGVALYVIHGDPSTLSLGLEWFFVQKEKKISPTTVYLNEPLCA